MPESNQVTEHDVIRFIYERIDSVPNLEALLLIRSSKPQNWSADELAQRLYIDHNVALNLLQDLSRKNLIAKTAKAPERYFYAPASPEIDTLIEAVHAKYRAETVMVSNMIHRKASLAVRDFADAFRFTKEKE